MMRRLFFWSAAAVAAPRTAVLALAVTAPTVPVGAAVAATVALVAGAGCDPSAQSVGRGAVPASSAALAYSREHESCSATSDCEAPLRCVEGACRRPTTSRLGEYYWASAELALRAGRAAAALEAFQRALGRFEEERIGAPPGLLCAYGDALRGQSGDTKAAEQAARLYHRCLLAAAPGSSERRAALGGLAALEDLGLDPELLLRDAPADVYLTRPPRRPPLDALRVEVARTQPARSPGYEEWAAALGGPATRTALAGCYEAYWAATQKPRLAVPLSLRFKARWDEDEEAYVGGALELAPGPGLAGPEAKAASCFVEALALPAAEFGKKSRGGSWEGSVTLTLSTAGS